MALLVSTAAMQAAHDHCGDQSQSVDSVDLEYRATPGTTDGERRGGRQCDESEWIRLNLSDDKTRPATRSNQYRQLILLGRSAHRVMGTMRPDILIVSFGNVQMMLTTESFVTGSV